MNLANCGLIANAIPLDLIDDPNYMSPYNGLDGALAGGSNLID